jgi:hypothetical protein
MIHVGSLRGYALWPIGPLMKPSVFCSASTVNSGSVCPCCGGGFHDLDGLGNDLEADVVAEHHSDLQHHSSSRSTIFRTPIMQYRSGFMDAVRSAL